jgi:flagellar basal-body rod protein FlgB
MKSSLDQLFAFNEAALRLRTQRQSVLASNIANADTPNYKARDFNFQDALASAAGNATQKSGSTQNALKLTLSSSQHLPQGAGKNQSVDAPLLYRASNQPSVDGNTVDLDVERAQFADNAMRYQATAQFISGQVRSMLLAINGQ